MSVIPSFPPNAANSRKSDATASPMDEVGKGHYLGMKYLFAMIGFYPARNQELPKIPGQPQRHPRMF
jgi:hypothetical protein